MELLRFSRPGPGNYGTVYVFTPASILTIIHELSGGLAPGRYHTYTHMKEGIHGAISSESRRGHNFVMGR